MFDRNHLQRIFPTVLFFFVGVGEGRIDGVEAIEARLLQTKETAISNHCELLGEEASPLSSAQAQNANSFISNVFPVSVGFSFVWAMYVCSVSQRQWNLNYFCLLNRL